MDTSHHGKVHGGTFGHSLFNLGHAAASQQPRQRSNFQTIFLKGWLTRIFSNIEYHSEINQNLKVPGKKIVILTTILSYLFIVSLLVACNHNIDLFILSGMPNYCHYLVSSHPTLDLNPQHELNRLRRSSFTAIFAIFSYFLAILGHFGSLMAKYH